MYVHAHSGGGESHRHGCCRADSSVFFGFDNSSDSYDRHCHLIVLGFELGSFPTPTGSVLPHQESAALGSIWSPADSDTHDTDFDLLGQCPWIATMLGQVIDLSLRPLTTFPPAALCDRARHDRSGVLLV